MARNFWIDPALPGFEPGNWTAGGITPRIDIVEDDKELCIFVELPGVKEEDIQLSLNEGVLTVSGEKRPHSKAEWEQMRPHHREEWHQSFSAADQARHIGPEAADPVGVQPNYYMAERAFGAFRRSITLPPGVDEDAAEADFAEGVLTIRLPRLPEARPAGKKIPIKSR